MLQKLVARVLVATVVAVLSGCGPSQPQTANEPATTEASTFKKPFRIAFSQCNSAEPYRTVQNNIFKREVAKLGAEFELVIHDAQQDNARQVNQIENIIQQGVDLLIVAPNEAAPLTPVVKKARDAGIKVICLERDLLEPVYDIFVGADNVKIGEMAGEFIQQYLQSKAIANPVVVEIKGLEGSKPQEERHNGARKFIDTVPNVKVIEEVGSWLQDEGRKRMETVLQANPKIDVVYGHNDPMAVGAYIAAQDAGREQEMIFVGVDGLGGGDGGIKKVMDGVLACTFIYPPCASEALEYAVKLLRGEAVPTRVILEPTKVTPESASDLYAKATVE
ncbi:MAG TPA: substrate-binding domain-containing protein [Candidatus Hydrogenedentes bacterium]|nr:substrate-binding domain-containing protein [Candidatus Hydrogenedentota bacterium]HRK35899.1 substrate-binding domain-containing protein [Candidatus Hydrogenedentota bacterium]